MVCERWCERERECVTKLCVTKLCVKERVTKFCVKDGV